MAAGEGRRPDAAGDDAHRLDQQALADAGTTEGGGVAQHAGGEFERRAADRSEQRGEEGTFVQPHRLGEIGDLDAQRTVINPCAIGKREGENAGAAAAAPPVLRPRLAAPECELRNTVAPQAGARVVAVRDPDAAIVGAVLVPW